ncbi:MAG: fumarylacetoacetate hydrolase family protein [Bacteroidales bacterium]|nr:fumarylacetoacetate hydrolase family protein [Bacteroidales bacterium]
MKIICIANNYLSHVKEFNNDTPTEIIFFLKPDCALLKNNKPFILPSFTNELHYEIEVVYHICKVGKNISERFAHRYYDKITAGIDFTARDLQRKCIKNGYPWEICKAFDNSAVIGSFIEKTKFDNINKIEFKLLLNNRIVQHSNVSDMIFKIDKIISYVSKFMTLKIGDLIFSGTPAGVGPVQKGDNLKGYINNILVFDFNIK